MKRNLIKVLSVVLTLGALLIAPKASEAASIVINNVSVTVGGTTWCISGCAVVGANGPIWGTAAGTVVNSPSSGGNQALVLTQTANVGTIGNVFNFDTSERGGVGAGDCFAPNACTTTLSVNGVAIGLSAATIANSALANFNGDDGSVGHNEASNWGAAVFDGGPGGLRIWFGYADTAHTQTCADTTGTVAGNCLPDNPWQGSANTVFVGGAVNGSSTVVDCERTGVTACFDAGAIRIELNDAVQTPEPSVLLMLGIGLVGIALVTRKRAKNSI